MADCIKLPNCPFFNDKLAGMPIMAEIYKQNYCRGDYDKCARLIVSSKLGPEKVPANLFPNDLIRATALVAQ